MTFEEWRKEAEQILMAWHDDDPACVDKDHWRQCFDRNYRPWEAALAEQFGSVTDDLGCETTSPRVSQFCALLLRRS